MTPVELFEYKKRWMRAGGYPVRLHSDLRSEGKDWCKIQCFTQQWDFKKWSNVYEDTFYFEYKQDAESFRAHFGKYADQEVL